MEIDDAQNILTPPDWLISISFLNLCTDFYFINIDVYHGLSPEVDTVAWKQTKFTHLDEKWREIRPYFVLPYQRQNFVGILVKTGTCLRKERWRLVDTS